MLWEGNSQLEARHSTERPDVDFGCELSGAELLLGTELQLGIESREPSNFYPAAWTFRKEWTNEEICDGSDERMMIDVRK